MPWPLSGTTVPLDAAVYRPTGFNPHPKTVCIAYVTAATAINTPMPDPTLRKGDAPSWGPRKKRAPARTEATPNTSLAVDISPAQKLKALTAKNANARRYIGSVPGQFSVLTLPAGCVTVIQANLARPIDTVYNQAPDGISAPHRW